MKVVLSALILCIVAVAVYSDHTFMGSNVGSRLVYNAKVSYSSKLMQKRVEYFNYNLPNNGIPIKAILAYDETKSAASANVTAGGLGFNFVQLRLKSARGKAIKYDVYLYQ